MPTVAITELTHCSTGVLTVLWVGALIASAICGLLIYSIASFRSAPDSSPVSLARRTAKEVTWAMIPLLILISTAMPSVKALVSTDNCGSALERQHFK